MKTKNSVNILLVDDERANLLAFSSILENPGVNLIYAMSGEEALRQALLNDFAVILLDFYLPTIGGLEVAQILRTRSQTPIIFITASRPEDFPIEEAYSLGAVDYLTKPYNPIVLKSKVEFFIELHKRTEALAASERARYLSELNIKEGRIRLILQNAKGYAFIVTDLDGVITEWEGDASAVTGWPSEDALGKSISLIYTEEDRFAGYPQSEFNAARLNGVASDKRWHIRKDGSRFYADGVLVPLKDTANQIHGFSKIFRDITSEQLAADELRRLADNLAEADRRKSEFLATLAHELRNPLAPIRNGLGILRVGGDSAASLAKTREMMERQVNHMVHLVDDLLDISRISGGKIDLKKESITIKELITRAVETSIPLIESGQHKLCIDIQDDSLSLYVDPNRIAQVISNLLNNAAKYTPAGGHIDVHVAVEGSEFTLSVEDNGIGIPPDALPTIFEMFNQVERNMGYAQGGLGLGLTLVRQIVEMHGGRVDVSSSENRGSRFIVKLPIVHCDEGCAADTFSSRHNTNAKLLRIMVVDDNVDAAQSLSLLLQLVGHTLFVAHDGQAAIKIAQEYKPHIAFLDIGMPGMDGYETAAEIRKIDGLEGMVLVALTGWGAEEDKSRSREAGFNNHLIKPAQLDAIESLLATLEPSFQ
ncbi:hybrid sensor histidine kinase/response regulator [Cellvibrio mixtus]|uniref:hybrid sensor histidine kinase/response regulator n=1 Tax=Cellvibrio mixtus TaxID=39650 RepID=UPI0006946939|nr:response regulator [Cellvibrio mixtus]